MKNPTQPALEFPALFPIKAIGKHTGEFELIVLEIVRRHAPEVNVNALTTRASNGGKYLAVTATILAQSQAQLDALYRELSAHDQVVYVL
jgi:putative lipoic acid-binding regulatory protein